MKVEEKWEKLPVAKRGDGYDWNYVVRGGQRIPAPTGMYYLEYRDPAKQRRAVGETPAEAKAALESQRKVLELRGRGVVVQDAPEIHQRRPAEGKTIASIATKFKNSPPVNLRPKSISAYGCSIDEFVAWAQSQSLTHVSQVGRDEIKEYMSHLLNKRGLAKKSVKTKTTAVRKIFRDAGVELKLAKGDMPRVTKKQPQVYKPEQLQAFFADLERDTYILFMTYLMTGFREQEIAWLWWDEDFDPRAGTLRVSKKPGASFDPKTYSERTIEIPPYLVDLLLELRTRRRKGTRFVFGTKEDKRDRHHLDRLKKLAFRKGLNCGHCQRTYRKKPASCANAPVCEKWFLHKFRHTYATTMLQDGWDVRTVQDLLGHEDLESTMIYVHGLPTKERALKIRTAGIQTKFLPPSCADDLPSQRELPEPSLQRTSPALHPPSADTFAPVHNAPRMLPRRPLPLLRRRSRLAAAPRPYGSSSPSGRAAA